MATAPTLRSYLLACAGGMAMAGCSAAGLADSATADAPTGTDSWTDSGSPTDPPEQVAVGYALEGRIELGAKGGDRAQLEIVTLDGDDAELCREPLQVQLAAATAPADEPLLRWWDVQLDVADTVCGVPADLFGSIGIGSWDERLQVALVQQGFDDANAFGLYLQEAVEGPVWVLGLVATEAQLAGDELAEVPLADGPYTVLSLVQAPWPEG